MVDHELRTTEAGTLRLGRGPVYYRRDEGRGYIGDWLTAEPLPQDYAGPCEVYSESLGQMFTLHTWVDENGDRNWSATPRGPRQ